MDFELNFLLAEYCEARERHFHATGELNRQRSIMTVEAYRNLKVFVDEACLDCADISDRIELVKSRSRTDMSGADLGTRPTR